ERGCEEKHTKRPGMTRVAGPDANTVFSILVSFDAAAIIVADSGCTSGHRAPNLSWHYWRVVRRRAWVFVRATKRDVKGLAKHLTRLAVRRREHNTVCSILLRCVVSVGYRAYSLAEASKTLQLFGHRLDCSVLLQPVF